MVKKKKSTLKKVNTKKNFSPFRWWKELYTKDRFISVFILMALVAVIAGVIWGSLIAYEKWQFNKAEKVLDSLYTDIVAELGEPVSYEKTKSCGYSSVKYSKGDLGCSINYSIIYSVEDASMANLLSNSISDFLYANYTVKYSRNNQFINGKDSLPGANPAFTLRSKDTTNINMSITYKDIFDQSNNSLSSSIVVVNFAYIDSKSLYQHYPIIE